MKSLNSRDRVNRALERKDHDRVPRHDTYWPETIKRWESEGMQDPHQHALAVLESDFGQLLWLWVSPFRGRYEVIREDADTVDYIDHFGASLRCWKNKSGTPEHLGWECTTPEIWRDRFKSRFDGDLQVPVAEMAHEKALIWKPLQKWTYMCGVEPFEQLRKLLGDEASLIAMIEEPEWIREIAEVTTSCTLRHFQAVLDAGVRPDGIWIYGDMAFNHSTMCSPALYEELIWPSHHKLCEWAHGNGLKFIYHTDGDVRGVMDLYIKAGFDAYQPIESKANMDIRELAPLYGDQLSFFGNIDVMKMITNDLTVLEEEISTKFKAGMAGRGYIYHSDHSVPPQVSWHTYQGIVRLIERYGYYR